MKKEPLYKHGDQLFFIKKGKLYSSRVSSVQTFESKGNDVFKVEYGLHTKYRFYVIEEQFVATSPEILFESMLTEYNKNPEHKY